MPATVTPALRSASGAGIGLWIGTGVVTGLGNVIGFTPAGITGVLGCPFGAFGGGTGIGMVIAVDDVPCRCGSGGSSSLASSPGCLAGSVFSAMAVCGAANGASTAETTTAILTNFLTIGTAGATRTL